MNAQLDDDIADRWASQLGLALSGMFAERDQPFGEAKHYALLDGITASFGLSVDPNSSEQNFSEVSSYAWSSNLRKHVVISDTQAKVISVSRPGNIEKYSLSTVNGQLERFLEYLSQDRQIPSTTVVEHVVGLLDKYRRAAQKHSRYDRDRLAMHALLLDLAIQSEGDVAEDVAATRYNVAWAKDAEVFNLIGKVRNFGEFPVPGNSLFANLAIRHAGGAIFQKITAALTLLPQIDLFTETQEAQFGTPQSLRMGGYFTPAGLARSLAEASIRDKIHAPAIRICDPACGSGVFLSEALRALSRAGYKGRVELVGRDILATAVEIANFVVRSAALDFGLDRVEIDVQVADSLNSGFGEGYDIVLMNPPYRAWEQSSSEDRECIREALGNSFSGKPDLSLAFANKALESLSESGVLAALLPVGVLTADYSRKWREQLCDKSLISLVGTLGDHYLFDYAMVNVAVVIAQKNSDAVAEANQTTMLWASQDAKASSNALRAIRKSGYRPLPSGERQSSWRTYKIRQSELSTRMNWAPTAFGSEDVISTLRARNFPNVEGLFKVQQGIRAGSRQAFIMPISELLELPEAERIGFRPVAEKDGIYQFEVRRDAVIFYADSLDAPIVDEDDLKRRFPNYFARYILPNREALLRRPRGVKLWDLSWSRAWLRKPEPKIVSRMFLGRRQMGFAVDEDGDLAVVQGYGWRPIWKEIAPRSSHEDKLVILYVYAFLLSSELFYDLVRTVSVNIAGGQFDLAPKYINDIPLPSWSSIKSTMGSKLDSIVTVRELASIFSEQPEELERFARTAFSISQ